MAERSPSPDGEIIFEKQPGGDTRAELRIDGHAVSGLWTVPFTLRIGAATVRMDGIAGVGTEKEHRRQGYSRRVLEATVRWMQQGDAALSMLYGIPDFYPKFGYATAGPDDAIELPGPFEGAALPPGWRVRPFAPPDLPLLQRLYDQGTARAVGAAVRTAGARPWVKLGSPEGRGDEECRVVEGPDGQIHAYAWLARWHWETGAWERHLPDALVIAEAMADGPTAADALLAACRLWAAELSAALPEPLKRVVFSLPHEGPVAAAAMYQPARFRRRFLRCGGSMVRVLSVPRLLASLQPELTDRLSAAGAAFTGTVRVETEIGGATLHLSPAGVEVEAQPSAGTPEGGVPQNTPAADLTLRLPQATLARLALGAFPPEDLLARLEEPPGEAGWRVMEALFPLRHPHMYLPDRF